MQPTDFILHPTLNEQLKELGLNPAIPPTPEGWKQFLNVISERYTQQQSTPIYHRYFEQCQDAVYIATPQGSCYPVNQIASSFFTYPGTIPPLSKLEDVFPQTVVAELKSQIAQAIATGEMIPWSYQFADHEHDVVRHQHVHLLADGEGRALIIVRDVTEQRWDHESIGAIRQYFRHLLQELQLGLLIYGPDAELILSNRRAQELFDLQPDKTTEKHTQNPPPLLMTEDGAAHSGLHYLVRQVIATGNPIKNMVLGLHRPQMHDYIWLLLNAQPERDDGQIAWVTITLSDVTDLRNTEEALRASEELYQSLIHHIRDVIFQIDSEGIWRFLNPAWFTLTGFPTQESIGRPAQDFIHPEDQARFAKLFYAKDDRSSAVEVREIRCRTQEGGYRWVNIHSDRLLSQDGVILGITGTLFDITERKQSERQAAELAAKEQLVVAMQTLLNHLSHDLRTPLSVIKANLFLVRRKQHDPAAVQGYTEIMDLQIERLVTIIDDVFTIFRLENKLEHLEFHQVDLNALIATVLANHEQSIQAKQLTLYTHLSDRRPHVLGDPIWLSRAIKDLLRNAIQYNLEHGGITVRTYNEDQYSYISIGDTGAGIDEADLPYIFEHFYRGDKTRSMRSGGAGLGLSIVKKVMEAHQGAITVTSVVGQGSTFQLQLPAIEVAQERNNNAH
jgi:PAS domain S-box-containing protein